jgi:Mitochondrial morphogenesis regulator
VSVCLTISEIEDFPLLFLVAGLIWSQKPLVSTPLCAVSIFCTGLYTISWNYDPCVKYQVG